MDHESAGTGESRFQRELKAAAADLRMLRAEHGEPPLHQIAARAPRGQSLSESGVSNVLRGGTLPRRDYYLTLVRVLLTYETGRIASLQNADLDAWRKQWERLKTLQREEKINKEAPSPASARANPAFGTCQVN